ncbi:hypothetical protein EVAR_12848_1 [Eumeta japonica]|uniref:Uncharacterized protein n=1 Tax=Eumeta variegata TaxID=151549 RepID=A0A4C1UAW6_EUMVA|nr:hypothetical protein EVAR_12848_1 [Eumeta japonica]
MCFTLRRIKLLALCLEEFAHPSIPNFVGVLATTVVGSPQLALGRCGVALRLAAFDEAACRGRHLGKLNGKYNWKIMQPSATLYLCIIEGRNYSYE